MFAQSAEGVEESKAGIQPAFLTAHEENFVEALCDGDEAAFETLLRRYHTALVRLARVYVDNQSVAEEVAQETWLAVFTAIRRFEGRSSLKTWLFRILINQAKKKARREGRQLFLAWEEQDGEPTVDPERFRPDGSSEFAGHWAFFPAPWQEMPENRLLSAEMQANLNAAIDHLPASQRQVILLRDMEGWTAEEVCAVLQISQSNQRVLLHRARARVRQSLANYLAE